MSGLFVSQSPYSFQVWPDLRVKPRLSRSSWRAFASTHPMMLPSTSPKEALLACPPFPTWNLLSFNVKSTLSSDLSLSCQGAALAHLDSFPLTIWYSGLTALFLFLLAKAALAYFPTAFTVALRPLFPSPQAQYTQVFLLKPAPFCKLFAGLGSTNKSATSLRLPSDSRSVLITLFSPPSFLFPQSLQIWQELSSLSSCSIRLEWVPRHSFLPGNGAADALLAPSAIPCCLSLLISRIHSCLFSD